MSVPLEEMIAIVRDTETPPGKLARVAESLGRVKNSPAVRPILLELLGTQRDPVALEGVIYGLRSHMNPEVLQKIRDLIGDESIHPLVRLIASEAILQEE